MILPLAGEIIGGVGHGLEAGSHSAFVATGMTRQPRRFSIGDVRPMTSSQNSGVTWNYSATSDGSAARAGGHGGTRPEVRVVTEKVQWTTGVNVGVTRRGG